MNDRFLPFTHKEIEIMKASLILIAFAFSAGLLATGFHFNALPDEQQSVDNGKILYETYCSTCHGFDGKGEGTAAIYLNPKPRDFTRGIFKFQSTPVGGLPTDEDLHRTLRNGMPGSAMPAWDRLTDQQ